MLRVRRCANGGRRQGSPGLYHRPAAALLKIDRDTINAWRPKDPYLASTRSLQKNGLR